MLNILISTSIFNSVDKLKEFAYVYYNGKLSYEELSELIIDYEILVVGNQKVDKKILEKAKRLKLIVKLGSGLDNIDLEECKKKKIEVRNTPDEVSYYVAEYILCMMLYMLRKLYPIYYWSIGNSLENKVIGIIGYGRIGKELERLLKVFNCKIIHYDIRDKKFSTDLDKLLKESDIVSINVDLNDSSRNLINKDKLNLLKRGVILINTSRSEVIDEDYLWELLHKEDLNAILDVYQYPVCGCDKIHNNIRTTPHIASNTIECHDKIEKKVIEIIKEFIK